MELQTIQRSWSLVETRVTDETESDDHIAVFDGHAAVFNQETLIGSSRYGFVEMIDPEAFEGRYDDDVRLLVNHDGLPLARTTNGTLVLSSDNVGLRNVARIADTSTGYDVVSLLRRGDVTQQSFAFTIEEQRWDETEHDGIVMDRRTITKIRRLYDTSIVTYPAYEGATGGLRTVEASETEIRMALREIMPEKDAAERAAETARVTAERVSLLRGIRPF